MKNGSETDTVEEVFRKIKELAPTEGGTPQETKTVTCLVVWFNEKKAFGFLKPKAKSRDATNGKDVYVRNWAICTFPN
jgi:hypothetical protein